MISQHRPAITGVSTNCSGHYLPQQFCWFPPTSSGVCNKCTAHATPVLNANRFLKMQGSLFGFHRSGANVSGTSVHPRKKAASQ